jgi:hypothetical protein
MTDVRTSLLNIYLFEKMRLCSFKFNFPEYTLCELFWVEYQL